MVLPYTVLAVQPVLRATLQGGTKRFHNPVGVLYLDSSSCSFAGSLGLLSLNLSTQSLKLLADLSSTSNTFHTDTSGKKPFKSVSYINLLLNTLPITSFHAVIVPFKGTYACCDFRSCDLSISIKKPLIRCRTILHSTVGTPKGLIFPLGLGM